MKKIVVTGATGFVGQHVIQILLDLNLDLDIVATARDVEKAKSFAWYSQVMFIPYTIEENHQDCYQLFGKPDILLHLAWDDLGDYNNPVHIQEHLLSHSAFIKHLVESGLQKVVVLGSCFEYGLCEGSIKEDLSPAPMTQYAVAKDLLRRFIVDKKEQLHFDLIWVRLFYTYGSGQRSTALLPQLEKAAREGQAEFDMSPGDQQHDYLPVEVAAEYIVKLTLQDRLFGAINCCSGEPTKLVDLVNDHLRKIGYRITLNLGHYDYSDYEPKSFWGNTEKLNMALRLFDEEYLRGG